MRRRAFLLGTAAVALPGAALAAPVRETAAAALARAEREAAASNRAVFLVFFASWCSWCRILDRLLDDRVAAPILARHFVVQHVRAQESDPGRRAQQAPDADALFTRLAGEDAGLPFFVTLDGAGNTLATSIAGNGENIGFPVDPDELAHFEAVLKRSAPAMTPAEIATLRAACVRLRPKR